MQNVARTQFIIDGNYTRKGFAHLATHGIEENYYIMDFVALATYVASVIEVETGLRCVYCEKKMYMGTNVQTDLGNQSYYRALDEAGFTRSTFNLRCLDSKSPYPALKEEAVDTTIAFEVAKTFYSKSHDERFNTLVLYAGDGDLVPVVQGLQADGVRVFVIYYDFKTTTATTRASQALLEAADKVISISSLLDERVSKQIKSIFRPTAFPHRSITEAISLMIESEREEKAYKPDTFILTREILEEQIAECRQDGEGWVLGAQLGKQIEQVMGCKLPVKLRPELEKYPNVFETKDSPAFSVRIRKDTANQKQRSKVVVVKKKEGGWIT
ncbi:MAG: NYN domain-containing protein [Treponema sp.]|nr:NYN domain-containing protein [Treponema sp.]